jgi:glycosyltransferase involved in cell wall biosynthesis
MLPHLSQLQHDESGIRRVIEAYFKHLPKFGVELVDEDETTYDLRVSHAASFAEDVGVAHTHGFYWTADYQAPGWEWMTNSWVVTAVRIAKEITVPSEWVAETFQRDMRFTPHIVPHGIDFDEWQFPVERRGFALWNKNRTGDVCDPSPVKELARRFPSIPFVSTFMDKPPENVAVIGVIPFEEMKQVVHSAAVYLATTKETFGIGILEAMASGVPVLGYAHGGILDLVEHGVTGYLAEAGNIDDLEEGFRWCMTNSKKAGANAREVAQRYDWDTVCEEVAYIYRLAMIEEDPTVSIVIPSYNYGDKVGKAVRSALRQTYGKVDQVVVVDDGSDDDGRTREVVEGIGRGDARVRYIGQENKGVAHARNAGIASVSSKYVCCLDADDEIGPRFVEVAVDALEADRGLGIAFNQLWFVKPDGSQGLSRWPGPPDFDRQIKKQNQIPTCCVFKREMWERLGGYKQKYAPKGAGSEDAEFWLRAGATGHGAKLTESHTKFREVYHRLAQQLKKVPTKEDIVKAGISSDDYDLVMDSLFVYSWQSGIVTGDPDYVEVDWTSNHPWAGENGDGQHPFASGATPERFSHPVRQYDEPVVSVVIPVGPGHEHLVRDALDSLDAQTMRRWEAIVVWDCAPDWDELESFSKAYPYVRQMFTHVKDRVYNGPLVHPYHLPDKSMGAGFARNIGAAHARAPFLWFLDADDWLYPETLQAVLDAWSEEGMIIYTDYVGKAIVKDPTQLAQTLQDHMYQWDGEEAVIGYKSADYDCHRAVREPTGEPGQRPYLWATVSCLIPKVWHEEIGGFDDQMETWEDVEYHWRMAKAGYCYSRLPQELIVYRFNEGTRRELGLQRHAEVVEYIRNKHKGIEVKMCNCGGRKKSRSSSGGGGGRPDPRPAFGSGPLPATRQQTTNNLTDADFVKAKYMHPNRGQHRVIGSTLFPTRFEGLNMIDKGDGFAIDYGYRAGGDTFLIHRADHELQAHLFHILEERIPTPATPRGDLPPPPSTPIPSHLEEIAQAASEVTDKTAADVFESIVETVSKEPPSMQGFDPQTLPGITAEIAQQFEADGIASISEIVELGVEGLQKYKGIGAVKAQRILDALAAIGG